MKIFNWICVNTRQKRSTQRPIHIDTSAHFNLIGRFLKSGDWVWEAMLCCFQSLAYIPPMNFRCMWQLAWFCYVQFKWEPKMWVFLSSDELYNSKCAEYTFTPILSAHFLTYPLIQYQDVPWYYISFHKLYALGNINNNLTIEQLHIKLWTKYIHPEHSKSAKTPLRIAWVAWTSLVGRQASPKFSRFFLIPWPTYDENLINIRSDDFPKCCMKLVVLNILNQKV